MQEAGFEYHMSNVYGIVSDPLSLWTRQWTCMSEDILMKQRSTTGLTDLELTEVDIQNYALAGQFFTQLYIVSLLPW